MRGNQKKKREKKRGGEKETFLSAKLDAGVGPFLFVMNEKILLLKLFNQENIYRTHVFLLRKFMTIQTRKEVSPEKLM
jgi:hypothetical protein